MTLRFADARSSQRPNVPNWLLVACVALSLAGVTVIYRFNQLGGTIGGLDNDHFTQLVRAVQALAGELPVRDYADAELRGLFPPLTYFTSAAVQIVHTSMLSEALLCIGALATGTALTYLVAAKLSYSVGWALYWTVAAAVLSPKLYNYPKVLLFAAAALAFLAWSKRPSVLTAAMLALVTVVAGLFRHDHAVLIGFASLVLLLASRAHRRTVAVFVVFVVLGFLPGAAMMQMQAGIGKYLRDSFELTVQEARRTETDPVPMEINWGASLWTWAVLPPPPRPVINVRWISGLSAEDRLGREKKLKLESGRQRDDPQNWAYELADTSQEAIKAVVTDPLIDDTHGIDRAAFRIANGQKEPVWTQWQREFPPLRLRLLPGILTAANAVPWMYGVCWAVPLLTALLCCWPAGFNRVNQDRAPWALLIGLTTLALASNVAFLRNTMAARLPDVAVVTAVLGAWLTMGATRAATSGIVKTAIIAGIVLVSLATASAAASIGDVAQSASIAGLTGGREQIRARWSQVWAQLAASPADLASSGSAEIERIAGYVRRCSSSDDRLLVADNAPELYYYSQRRFAAGQAAFFSNFYTSEEYQQLAVTRLSRQNAPILLLQSAERLPEEFASDYPTVNAYVQRMYQRAGTLEYGNAPLDAWIRKEFASAPIDSASGLACPALSNESPSFQ